MLNWRSSHAIHKLHTMLAFLNNISFFYIVAQINKMMDDDDEKFGMLK